MFWGLILEPEKRYSQVVKQPFHVSHAVLDVTTGDGQVCQVLLRTTGGNFILCSLQKGKEIQTPLDLYFKAGSDITFSTNGKCQVHLTGYVDPEVDDEESDEEEEEETIDETVLEQINVGKEKKRKLNSSAEESTNKKAKKEKVKQENGKKPSKAGAGDGDSDDSSDDDEVNLQDLLDGEDIDSDEQDNSYRVDDLQNSSLGDSAEEEDSDEDDDDDDDDDDDEEEEEDDEEEVSEAETSPVKKKDKKNKQDGKPQLNGIDDKKKKENEQNQEQQKNQKKKKNKEEKKQQNEKPQQPQREKKTISGGVHIEDLKVGDGPQAVSGKSIQVYYEGRLKNNNKMFDKHLNGPGFKFRLGGQEVIRGWDVGVAGMRVGGKRKITCPPNMAYGAKGSPPLIPPNSTLVFEVELKRVN